MKLNKQTELKGRFKIHVQDAVTLEERDYDWQDNVFLQRFFTSAVDKSLSAPTCYCHFGTGTTTPTVTDSGLTAPLGTFYYIATESNFNKPNYVGSRVGNVFTREFEITLVGTQGQVRGNVTELGLASGVAQTTLFTHALIKDSEGAPLTITLGANDIITVTYTISIVIDVTDPVIATKVFTFNGVETTATYRYVNYDATDMNAATLFGLGSIPDVNFNWSNFFGSGQYLFVASGIPSDYGDLNPATLTALGGYININTVRTSTSDGDSLNTTTSDLVSGVGVRTGIWNGIYMCFGSGFSLLNTHCSTAITFDPPLVKTAADIFTINSLVLEFGGTPS